MSNKNRVVRALAGLVALGAVCGLSAAAVPQIATADAQAGDHLTRAVLLNAADLRHAGWTGTEATAIDTDYGSLLGQCAGPTPDLAPGFVGLEATGLYTSADEVNADGVEFVMAFKTNSEARDYFRNYCAALEGRCLDRYGPRAWDVTRSARVTLHSNEQHARTWMVKDSTGGSKLLSVTMVRVGGRVALVWLEGYNKTNPAKSLHLHRLTQTAADRIAA